MEVRFYDASLNFLGLIENQSSLTWTRRYFEPGEFELHCPITDYNRSLCQMGNLVWLRGAAEAGVIEYVIMEQSNTKNEITAKGRFLESYFDRRLIKNTYTVTNGLVEEVMRTLITNAVPIPLMQMGDTKGYTERVTFQATYKNLLTYLQKLSTYSNIGFRCRPDFTNKTITFETYKGTDRSVGQSDNNRVVFSEKYNNISNAKYTTNSQTMKSVCYVGGEGEGSSRVYVIAGDNDTMGLERREVFLDAKDVQSSEFATTAAYQAALVQRGQDTLDKDVLTNAFECTTEANSNFIYKKNYDLGDIVTINKTNWGISTNLRITEIQEVYEFGYMAVNPTFGTPLPSTIDWEDK